MKLDSLILNNFFEMLNNIKADYCVMNNYEDLPEIISSDVDFAVDLHTFQKLDGLIIQLANDHNVGITQKIWHGYNKCAYILSPLEIDSYFYLQLDFFVDFSGRGFPNLFPNNLMQYGKKRYKNFYVPSVEVEVPFLLQRRIFKGDINDSHVQTLVKLYNTNHSSIGSSIKNIFGEEVGDELITFIKTASIENFNKNYSIYRKKLKEISTSNTDLLYRAKYILWQFIRAMYRLYYPTGLSVAFVGENTALKKELITNFDTIVSGSYHGLTYLTPSTLADYIKKMMAKAYWAKVTKKKVILNLDSLKIDWQQIFSNTWLKYVIPVPDVIINLDQNIHHQEKKYGEYNLTKQEDMDNILKDVTYKALTAQVQRTRKHLMNKISPTV